MSVAQGEQPTPDAQEDEKTAAGRLAAKRAAKAAAKAKQRAATTTATMPEEIAASVLTAKSWYDTHGRTVAFGLVGALALGAGAVGLSRYLEGDRARDAEILNVAITAANAPILPEGEEPPEGVDESFVSVKARAEKTLEEARKAAKVGTDDARRWAALTEANALAQLDKRGEAKAAYDRVLVGGDQVPSVLRYRALEGQAFLLEADGKYADAQKRYEQISALEGGAYKTPGEYHRARMLIALGDRKKAAEVLDALLKADRNRPASEARRFEDTITSAEQLLGELAVTLGDAKLKPQSAGPQSQEDLMNMLRTQLKLQGADVPMVPVPSGGTPK